MWGCLGVLVGVQVEALVAEISFDDLSLCSFM